MNPKNISIQYEFIHRCIKMQNDCARLHLAFFVCDAFIYFLLRHYFKISTIYKTVKKERSYNIHDYLGAG